MGKIVNRMLNACVALLLGAWSACEASRLLDGTANGATAVVAVVLAVGAVLMGGVTAATWNEEG